jgi:hypothetical protein
MRIAQDLLLYAVGITTGLQFGNLVWGDGKSFFTLFLITIILSLINIILIMFFDKKKMIREVNDERSVATEAK